jgi:predicted hydrocarbon binding protein
MQGIMFVELSGYIEELLGPKTWKETLVEAGLDDRVYTLDAPAPDDEFLALVTIASTRAGRELQSVLESFGEYVAPHLLGGEYGALVDPGWDLLDFLEHTETAIHTAVRERDPRSRPPKLRVVRPLPDQILVLYESSRRMCSVAKGIIRGAARHYDQEIQISEPRCMLAGAARCEITVRRVPEDA